MTPLLGVTFDALTNLSFWISVGVIAGTYALVALGLQLNTGFTGIVNFGQAAFMAIGAYTMAILVLKAGFSFWLSLPFAVLAAMIFGVIVGLPALRLRADYFAIATIAMAEVVRLFAQNARGLTGGNQGLFCDDGQRLQLLPQRLAGRLGLDQQLRLQLLERSRRALSVAPGRLGRPSGSSAFALSRLQRTPWGRVLRAIREDEDAAQALGKNTCSTSSSRWRSRPAWERSPGSFWRSTWPRSTRSTSSRWSPSSPSAC